VEEPKKGTMTKHQWEERLSLIQALIDGKTIERFYPDDAGGQGQWWPEERPDFMGPVSVWRLQEAPK